MPQKYYYVGITPLRGPCLHGETRKVLCEHVPESLESVLNTEIDWHRFEERPQALAKVEELQQLIEANLII